MPSKDWNVSQWDGSYDWSQRGEEWSSSWGNSEAQWFGSIYSRIHRFLPAKRILEIAPGFGRWTKFLAAESQELVGVDLSGECVSHLNKRFQSSDLSFFQNDGQSLDFLNGQSPFDFVFSFDSLVHVEIDILTGYIQQVLPLLASGGAVFFHHSNWAATNIKEENKHFRAESVSAGSVRKAVERAGGRVLVQELINWGCQGLSDCLTLFCKAEDSKIEPRIISNSDWMEEARIIREKQSTYTNFSSDTHISSNTDLSSEGVDSFKKKLQKTLNQHKKTKKLVKSLYESVKTGIGKCKKRDDIPCYEDYTRELGVAAYVHPDDFIFQFLINHPNFPDMEAAVRYYFMDARKSANNLVEIFKELGIDLYESKSMLEFASGYGCLTRHLPVVIPQLRSTACDLHTEAVKFIQTRLKQDAILSHSDPDKFTAPEQYDIVFALSFFSHMPKSTWGKWVASLFSVLKPGGVLIFTTQGLASAQFFGHPDIPEDGFWFKAESEQKDLDTSEYGQTIVLKEFVEKEVMKRTGRPLAMHKEAFWWNHQDLYIIKKVPQD